MLALENTTNSYILSVFRDRERNAGRIQVVEDIIVKLPVQIIYYL